MEKINTVIQFLCYSPGVYSGLDKFNLEAARKLNEKQFRSVFVYSDKVELKLLIHDLHKHNVIIELIPSRNKASIFLKILKIYIKYKPCIVHSHFDNYILLITAFLSTFFRARYFVTFHSLISDFNIIQYRNKKGIVKFLALRLFYRFLLRAATNVLCVSDAIKTQFLEYSGSGSNKIECFYLGVNINPQIPGLKKIRSQLLIPDKTILICNISAIEPLKGIDLLIEAMFILKERYELDNFACIHIGGLRFHCLEHELFQEHLHKQIIEKKLVNHFFLLGKRDDVDEVLSEADIYVHPSRKEGIGMALMEACARSLPLVGSNVGGIPEIIRHNRNGFLFSPGSSEELADFLKLLIQNEECRKKMGNQALKIVSEKFDILIQADMLTEKYLNSWNI